MRKYLFPARIFALFISILCLILTYFNNEYLNIIIYSVTILSIVGIIILTIYDLIIGNEDITYNVKYNKLNLLTFIFILILYGRFFFDNNIVVVSNNLTTRYSFISMYMPIVMICYIFLVIYHILLEIEYSKNNDKKRNKNIKKERNSKK